MATETGPKKASPTRPRRAVAAALLVLQEQQALRVRPVRLVLLEQQGRWELRVPLAALDQPEQPVRLVPWVRRARPVLSEPLALSAQPVQSVQQAHQVRRA
jgi:hypothetical protein